MLKKRVLTLTLFALFTTFYGFDAPAGAVADSRPEALTSWRTLLPEGTYVISTYDNLMRHISAKEGQDWRLMSAIAYHESRFRADITSPGGAVGLMQIMPSVARRFNISTARLRNPETSIRLATRLLEAIENSLDLGADTAPEDRMSIVLASYNCGIGHVQDARRLARLHGEDPDSWAVVAHYLQLKANPKYYNDDVVKCGRFSGSSYTLAYVDDVMGRYERYCKIAEE